MIYSVWRIAISNRIDNTKSICTSPRLLAIWWGKTTRRGTACEVNIFMLGFVCCPPHVGSGVFIDIMCHTSGIIIGSMVLYGRTIGLAVIINHPSGSIMPH